MVEISDFAAIGELHAVAQPVKTVRQDDLARSSSWGAVDINTGNHLVAIAQVDLPLMGVGECVWLPKRHVSIIAGSRGQEANP